MIMNGSRKGNKGTLYLAKVPKLNEIPPAKIATNRQKNRQKNI